MHSFIAPFTPASSYSKTVFSSAIEHYISHTADLDGFEGNGNSATGGCGNAEGPLQMTNGISHIFTGTPCLWTIPKHLFKELNLNANIAAYIPFYDIMSSWTPVYVTCSLQAAHCSHFKWRICILEGRWHTKDSFLQHFMWNCTGKHKKQSVMAEVVIPPWSLSTVK